MNVRFQLKREVGDLEQALCHPINNNDMCTSQLMQLCQWHWSENLATARRFADKRTKLGVETIYKRKKNNSFYNKLALVTNS